MPLAAYWWPDAPDAVHFMNGNEQRRRDYLAKALEAEELAGKATDEQSKAEWLRIAAGYHALVARQDRGL